VSTFEGVNDELGPVLRMTAPASARRLDRLSFEPRLPGSGPLLERIIGATFRHRHRRLRRRFG
jgi:hypothetical protein